jgi:hypothetical protein
MADALHTAMSGADVGENVCLLCPKAATGYYDCGGLKRQSVPLPQTWGL